MLKICKIGISTELQSYRATELQRSDEMLKSYCTLLLGTFPHSKTLETHKNHSFYLSTKLSQSSLTIHKSYSLINKRGHLWLSAKYPEHGELWGWTEYPTREIM